MKTWEEWHEEELQQLDNFRKLEMYSDPVDAPPNAIILRPHWQYAVKRDGQQRSRQCCDGSKRAAPRLHALAQTYSACVEEHVQRLFLAISAKENPMIYSGDASGAYSHSPPSHIDVFSL